MKLLLLAILIAIIRPTTPEHTPEPRPSPTPCPCTCVVPTPPAASEGVWGVSTTTAIQDDTDVTTPGGAHRAHRNRTVCSVREIYSSGPLQIDWPTVLILPTPTPPVR